MLWLEGNKSKNSQLFEPMINRIESMSLLHEYLYNSKQLDQINIDDFFKSIIQNINIEQRAIQIEENYSLNQKIQLKNAITLGMILNELVTNSVKHNQESKGLKITIQLYNKENKVFFKIKDNGKGFDIDKHTDGIGLNLVKDFSDNLPNSQFLFHCKEGTRFELEYDEEGKK